MKKLIKKIWSNRNSIERVAITSFLLLATAWSCYGFSQYLLNLSYKTGEEWIHYVAGMFYVGTAIAVGAFAVIIPLTVAVSKSGFKKIAQ